MNSTLIWGTIADSVGIICRYEDRIEALPGGGARARRTESVEPASVYACEHPAPMPMRWSHGEEIGRIVALRRAHGNLYTVSECELEPEDLVTLAGESGLRWSTGTNNRRHEPLRITEISLVREAATNGLPPVSWYKLGVSAGNPPDWVRAELKRADSKIESRSRRSGKLLVHEIDGVSAVGGVSAADEYEQIGRDLGLLPGGYEHRIDPGGLDELSMAPTQAGFSASAVDR